MNKRTDELIERVNELNCLYEITNIVDRYENNIEKILQSVIDIIPSAMQQPEYSFVRLTVEDRQYYSGNWQESSWTKKIPIFIEREECGLLEVGVSHDCLSGDNRITFVGKEKLLNIIAERIGRIIERIQIRTELNRKQEYIELLGNILDNSSQSFLIENTDGSIGLCNTAFEQLVGYTKEELTTISWDYDLNPPEWQDMTHITQKKMSMIPRYQASHYENATHFHDKLAKPEFRPVILRNMFEKTAYE